MSLVISNTNQLNTNYSSINNENINYTVGFISSIQQFFLTSIQQEESFNGELIHLGSSFKEKMPLNIPNTPELLKEQILQKTITKIYKTMSNFNFFENGFEFHDFSTRPLGQSLTEISKDSTNRRSKSFAREVENQLSIWGRDAGIKFNQVVMIESVYRNTAEGKFGAVHFVHVDFPEADHSQTLKEHANWKVKAEEVLGEMSNEQYEKLNVSKIVNIWMPLDQQLEAEPLAMLDISTLNQESQLRTYNDERTTTGTKYQSVGVIPHSDHRWYIKQTMKLGEAIIFNSCQTPHSAVSLPNQQNKGRTSIECRVLFLKNES